MNTVDESVAGAVETLVSEVEGWEGVAVGDHRFGGIEFLLGPRELGHVHRWGMLDVPFNRPLRDALVAEGATGDHHLLSNSGWTTFYLRSPDDLPRARWLLRLSYLYHVSTFQRTGKPDVPTLDVAAALDELEPSAPVRAAFERRRPAPT